MSKKSILWLALPLLAAASGGCLSRDARPVADGLYFNEVYVLGTASVAGADVQIDATMKRVYVIGEDELVELLKQ